MADQLGLNARLTFDGTQAITGMAKTNTAFTAMQAQMGKVRAGFGQVKAGLGGLRIGGIIAGVGIGAAIRGYAKFDSTMAGVRAQLGIEASKDFPRLETAARSMAAETGKAGGTVAEGMKALAEKGLDANEILQAIKPTLNGMTASGTDANTSAVMLVDTYRKFGLGADQAGKSMDTIVQAARLGGKGGAVPEFASALQSIGGTAQLLHLDMKDAAAGLALFTKGGLDSGSAAMNLNMALLKMSRASKDGYLSIAGLGKVAIPTKNGAMDLQGTMTNIAVALNYVKDPMERVNLAMSLFGMRGRESAAALEKLTKDPTALPKMFADIRNKSDGATAAMAKMKTDTLEGRFKKLQNALANVSMEIGSAFLPFVERGVKAIVPMAQQFATAFRFFTTTPGAVEKMGTTIAGVSPTITAMSQGLIAGFAGVKEAANWVIGGVRTIGGLFGGGGPGSSGIKTTMEWAVKLAAVAGAYKLLGPVIKSAMNIGIGAGKMLVGSLSALGTASTGLLGLIGKRFPAVAKMLPRGAGALGKVLGAAEKITAQPVRIVNWDEAGMAGTGGTSPGALPAPGATPGSPQGWRARASGKLGSLGGGVAMAVGGGIALNMLQGEMTGPIKTVGNTILGISAMFGPAGMAVGGIAAATMAFGTKIDEWTGASTFAANSMFNFAQSISAEARAAAMRAYTGNVAFEEAMRTAKQMVGIAGRGGTVGLEGGVRRGVTSELIQERIAKSAALAAKSSGATVEEQKAMVQAVMREMGPQLAAAIKNNIKVEATLLLDSRPVAKGVAGAEQEKKERRGESQAPGSRRRAAS